MKITRSDHMKDRLDHPFYFSTSREIIGLTIQDLEYSPTINAASIPHRVLPTVGVGRRDTQYPLTNTTLGEIAVRHQMDVVSRSVFQLLGSISHYAFEMICIDILEKAYSGNGIQTPRTNDGGIDGVIFCKSPYQQTYLIQAKQYTNPVGLSEIDDFIVDAEIWNEEHSDEAELIFVALNGYTQNARDRADEHGVCLFSGEELAELALKFDIGIKPVSFPLLDRDYWRDLSNVN